MYVHYWRWIQRINATLYLYSMNKRWSGYGIQNPNQVLSRTEIRDVGSMAARRVSQSNRSYIWQAILVDIWSIVAHRRHSSTHSETIKISANALSEREEISRGLATQQSLRAIAKQLGRSPSTISREIHRNLGYDNYRATQADQAAWDKAHRPKLCKLSRNPTLWRIVAVKL